MSRQFRFSSHGLDETDAFEQYRRLYSGGSDVSRGEGPFRAEVTAWQLDGMLLFDRRLSGVVHSRLTRARSDGFGHAVLTLVCEGALDVEAKSKSRVAAGEIVVFDARQAWRTSSPAPVSLITVSVSRDLVEAALGPVDASHGRILPAPANLMLGDYMTSLAARAARLAPEALPSLSRAFMDLLCSAASAPQARLATEKRRLDFLRREAVNRHLDQHLADRGVSATTISQATGISRSSLYRLFEKQGGVAAHVQRRRLDAVRSALDTRSDTSLSQLAQAHGFADESHMSRLFSEAYGAPPGTYRQQMAAAGELGDTSLANRRWAGWMTHLG